MKKLGADFYFVLFTLVHSATFASSAKGNLYFVVLKSEFAPTDFVQRHGVADYKVRDGLNGFQFFSPVADKTQLSFYGMS